MRRAPLSSAAETGLPRFASPYDIRSGFRLPTVVINDSNVCLAAAEKSIQYLSTCVVIARSRSLTTIQLKSQLATEMANAGICGGTVWLFPPC